MRKFFAGAAAVAVATAGVAQTAASDDPYLWLEEIEGTRAIEQVKKWNAATEALLTVAPEYEPARKRALAILDDDQQIAAPEDVIGESVTNLWRDAKNPRGLWRVASLSSYVGGKPDWRTLIDVDALGKQEGKSWVWHGANCLAPEYRRCLVSLSPGGTDAGVVREFDISSGKFVENGFVLPDAKSSTSWFDRDHLLVATDYGKDSLTTSGYPRIVKLWTRGSPLSTAKTLFTAESADVSASPFAIVDSKRRWSFVNRSKTTWTSDLALVTSDAKVVKVPIPDTASPQDVIDGRLIVQLNESLGTLPTGALVSWSLPDIEAGREAPPRLVMAPTAKQAIEDVGASNGILWVKALDDVSGKLFALWPRGNEWGSKAIDLPANSTIHLLQTAGERDLAFATVEGMLTPPTLYAVTPNESPVRVQSLPARFDANAFTVDQRFATSKDGTRVPYFLVRKMGTEGAVPTLIHAYGGFRNAQTPGYLTGQPYRAGPLGMFWVEEGNAYVLANIRGGGEYGPEWHKAALREHRQRSFDDLHAVAEDLIRTGVTAKGKIGISGRSNGGVLVGAALNQRPDLYSAAIIGSPLFDMKRYSHLLAGASWIDEYGDPDKPDQWTYLSKYSPYQNLRRDVRYPAVFLYSSTKDDRVHPGHARKAAARLIEYGNRIYFHEYMEGGHSVGADNVEDAKRAALLLAYLNRELGGKH